MAFIDLSNLRTCEYLRKSREDRDCPHDEPIEVTLKRHETTLLAFAKEHKLPIIETKKEVVSGDKLSTRPKMLEMLEEIEEGLYDAVLVMDFDRLGRGSMLDQGIILNTLKENNILIITLDKIYDLNDDMDEERADFDAFFARKELKMIKKRLGRGRVKSVEEGNYIGGFAPFGYDYNKNTKLLEINEYEATLVKNIFDMYVNQNMGDAKISNFMNENNFKTKFGRSWDKTTVRKIITNPIYIGKTRWKDKIYQGKHTPIISNETFDKAQELTKGRYIPRVKDSYSTRNPLAGLLKCPCGRSMSLRTSKNQPDSLRCLANCGNKGTYVYVVEAKLIEILRSQLSTIYSNLEYHQEQHDNLEKYNLVVESNTKDLKKAYEQKNKLFDLLEQEVYDNQTFLERMKYINEKIQILNTTIDEAKSNLNTKSVSQERTLPEIKNLIDYIDNGYWESTAKEKNEFMQKVIDYAVFTKKEIGLDSFQLEVFLKL